MTFILLPRPSDCNKLAAERLGAVASMEQLDRLQSGVKAWNDWSAPFREGGWDVGLFDLRGAPLSGAELPGVILSGADLTEALCSGANLVAACLVNANLKQPGLGVGRLGAQDVA